VVAEVAACVVLVAVFAAETWHARRTRRIARLAFGPRGRPAEWARLAPVARTAALTALAWGLVTLLLLQPRVHRADDVSDTDYRHLILVLDVSPSMRLQDAGRDGQQTRMQRAADLVDSCFSRVAIERHLVTVVACYNGAKPVVIDTKDSEVVRNIMRDLPMQYAFRAGKTNLFAGLEEAARIAHPWPPKSASLVLLSDGDTVPATGMPKMPASIARVLVVGVGDPRAGKFIDGHQSRQDASTLRQIAVRLRGIYHDGNQQHVSTEALADLTAARGRSKTSRLTRREYALLAIGAGAAVYALLPLLLHLAGTSFRPGVPASPAETRRKEFLAAGRR
jgi:Ca-activated chloride channel family protein